MIKVLPFFFFILFAHTLLSQDIDIYQKGKNDNYNMPVIDQAMTYKEFNLLSQNVKMKDMLYGIMVPGHIHFKSNSRQMGFWLVGVRATSYATIGWVYWYANKYSKNIVLSKIQNNEGEPPLKTILYGAVVVAASTYVFDLIHGEGVLKRKQEKIRYKYSLKLQSEATSMQNLNNSFPAMNLVVNF